MKFIAFFLMVSCAFADSALIDANGNVVSISPVAMQTAPGCSVVSVTDSSAIQPREGLEDDNGKLQFKVISGVITRLVTAKWPDATATDFRVHNQRRIIDKIDDLHVKIMALERWQSLFSATRDRTTELNALTAKRDQLISILTGP